MGFSALDCPVLLKKIIIIIRMALLTHFLGVLVMILIRFSKICDKAASVRGLAMQAYIHDWASPKAWFVLVNTTQYNTQCFSKSKLSAFESDLM